MSKISSMILAVSAAVLIGLFSQTALAENQISVSPLDSETSLQTTTMLMTVPSDNSLPWGVITGSASDYVERHPAIIQLYQDEEPVHVAQVDLRGDGSFEYRFRVGGLNSDTGSFENYYGGQYIVKVFRVVPSSDQAL